MISGHSCARAGLLGNPSDGYGGKTISFAIGQYSATVELRPARRLRILPGAGDTDEYDSLEAFAESVERQGLYGGVRLLKATLKRFHDYCGERRGDAGNFSLGYRTNIPRGVGLAGSSAIVTAALKALCAFHAIDIPAAALASLALSVERDVLGIPAGLQDRVIQMLGGVVFMDFDPAALSGISGLECGRYEPLPIEPPGILYVAFHTSAGEPTEVVHNDLAARYRAGDRAVVDAMKRFAAFAGEGRAAWLNRDGGVLAQLMDANFDLRRSICRIAPRQLAMVDAARSTGASAKFCGSGGAITGLVSDPDQYDRLVARLAETGCHVFQPEIPPGAPGSADSSS